jgi:hypothetical protein
MAESGRRCENEKVRRSSLECHQVGLTWEEYFFGTSEWTTGRNISSVLLSGLVTKSD